MTARLRRGRPAKNAPAIGRPERADITGAPGGRANSALAWYRWYPGDHLRQTRGWSLTARAILRELLDAQWDAGSLPEDPEDLRTLISATVEEWQTAWPTVESSFPAHRGRRQHRGLEQLRIEATARLARQQAASQRAHDTRWGLTRAKKGDEDA